MKQKQGGKLMKKTRWNPYKFKENVIDPIAIILILIGSVVVI